MKKFFTLLMAMVVSASMMALPPVELGKKVDPTGHATKMVEKKMQHKQDVAKVLQLNTLERKAMPKAKHTIQQLPAGMDKVQKAQKEVITLTYDGFAAMQYYELDEEWWIGMSCDDMTRYEYGHNLNLEWKAPADNPCGTFTTEDFVYDYTHLTTPFSYGSIHFSEISMTLTHEKVNAHLERYVLKATLIGEDGNTYEVHAVHENIVPKGQVESVILDAALTTSDLDFTLEGQNEDLDIKLVFNNSDIVGSYGMNMIKWADSKIAYKGVDVSPMNFKATINLATHTENGSLAYVTEVKMMGNDTINYHFVIAAPLPAPTDTIELTAVDLKVDDSSASFFGSIDFYASTNDFAIRGGWQATIIEEGTYKAAIFLDDAEWNTITSLEAEITISLDKSYNWVIDGTMLGSDNKVYNLHLTWSVPEQTDTVLVAFEHSAKAKYYPHLDNDIQLYNENDLYSASINVAGVELGGDFDEEQIFEYFTYLELKNGTILNVAEKVNGKLYQVGDTTKMEIDYVTFQGILYQVRLWHVASTPTKTINLTIENAEFIQDFDYNGVYNLVGYTEDLQTAVVFTVYATAKEDIPGTFVNDGKFGEFGEGQYDFDASNSFVGKYNESTESYDLYYIQKGQFTVTLDENDNIALTASVIAEDAIQYDVTLTSKYERPHLDYDATDTPVERTYGAADMSQLLDWTADYGLIFMELKSATEMDMVQMYFVAEEGDADIVIPEGTYEINTSWEYGSVVASTGVDYEGKVQPSYYGMTDAEGYLITPLYYFVEGTVEVTKTEAGKLRIEIHAINSYEVPIHIVYDPSSTAVEDIQASTVGAKKAIKNGQLIIIRNGEKYNAVGAKL